MLQILIITNDVGNSVIKWNEDNCGAINGLPQKLRDKVFREVRALRNRQVTAIEYKMNHFILKQKSQNYVAVPCPEFLKGVSTTILIETMQLLHWYVSPHLRARDPDLLGSSLICCDCGLTQRRGSVHRGYCEFVGCPSHAKWAEIIEGYEVPKYLSDETLARAVQILQENKQNSLESLQGDDANKWIQKG